MLDELLSSEGYQVGLFTSPRIHSVQERIKVNGYNISDEDLCYFVNLLYPIILEYDLMMFEILFLVALNYFEVKAVDFAIIECGIGGLHDSTNIIDPILSIITNVSLDHQAMLGNSLAKISMEKAGIIKEKGLSLVGDVNDELALIFSKYAKSLDNRLFFVNDSYKQGLDHAVSYQKETFY